MTTELSLKITNQGDYHLIGTIDPLRVTVRLDDETLFDQDLAPRGTVIVSHSLPDDEKTHRLSIEMQGKKPGHTSLDAQGTVQKDCYLMVEQVKLDEINLDHIMTEVARYSHDNNGTTSAVIDRFYGNMGCNGTVTLDFYTPVYLWLLENM